MAPRSISWRVSRARGRCLLAQPAARHRRGEKRLFVGDDGRRLVATALLMFAQQPNQPHRAEIGKMLVLAAARRQGLGRRLLAAAEQAAREPAARC